MAGTADELRELAARFRRIAGTGNATDESIRSAEADGGRLISSLIHLGRYAISDDAQLTYRSVAPFKATDARLREYQLSWLWQAAVAYILPPDMRQPSECGDNHAAAERNALAAERLADQMAEVVPPEPDQVLTDEPVTPAKLADRLGIPDDDSKTREALCKRLERWRNRNRTGGWIVVADPKPRQPKYLYPFRTVWPIVADLKRS